MGATKLMTAAGGGITLDAASTASDKTITVPARTGNMAVDGPAFSAYLNANQSLSNATWTKITINTEDFDTNNNFDSTTNYRFTPTVAGYYQINGSISWGAASGQAAVGLYKNGAFFKVGSSDTLDATANTTVFSFLVFANGTTDYFELYGNQNSGGALVAVGSSVYTTFSASLARAA